MKKRIDKRGRSKAPDSQEGEKKPRNKFQVLVHKSVIMTVKFAAVIGGAYFAGAQIETFMTEEKREQARIQSELRKVEGKTSGLQSQMEDLGAAAQIYADLAEQRDSMEFMIAPLLLRPLLAELKDKYHISTLNLELTAPKTVDMPKAELGDVNPVRFSMSIKFASLSDHFVYQFIEEMRHKMPGFLHFKSFDMQKIGAIDIEALSKLSRGEKVETIQGELTLDWYGFMPKEEDAG